MAIEDLDLEFEDEEEQEKSDALEVDVDLSFSASNDSKKSQSPKQSARAIPASANLDDATDPNLSIPHSIKPQKITTRPTQKSPAPAAVQKPTQKVQARSNPKASPQSHSPPRPSQGQVRKLSDHPSRANQSVQQTTAQQARVTSQEVASPQVSEDYSFEIDTLREELGQLRLEIQQVKNSADVKVAVAEAKSEFMLEHMSNAKLLDHQVNQVLQRVHKKVPGLKNEVLTIKKYMTEFLEKNTKKN